MSDLNLKEIGSQIRIHRREKKLTQKVISEKLDISLSHISNIECGRILPSLDALIRLANILECSIDTFVFSEYTFHGNMAVVNKETFCQDLSEMLLTCDPAKRNQILQIIDLM